jgi:CelD/BcsL family acetyltransferase involved in cellulose biosynthesis
VKRPQPDPASGMGSLQALRPEDPDWVSFLAEAPDANAFHHPAWLRAVTQAYGYTALALVQRDAEGRIVAGVPAAQVRRPSGRVVVSLPFSDHCSPLARDEPALRRLARGIGGWASHMGAAVELRGGLPEVEGWASYPAGVLHLLRLEPGPEVLWRELRESFRRQIRQARRAGLRVRFSREAKDLDAFYRLQVATRRRQGVPVQPRRFVASVWRECVCAGPGWAAIVETPQGLPVAASLLLAWNGWVIEKFQASDADYWPLKPNQLLIWSTIEWSCEQGYRLFDFGRTDLGHHSLQRFKAAWGAEPVPLRYSSRGRAGARASADGRLGGLLRAVVQRSPALVCRALGELLYRYAA